MVLHKCTQDGCDYSTNYKCNLKVHLSTIHDIGVQWHSCTQEGCQAKFKQKSNLKQHLSFIHDIGVKWYPCAQEGCQAKFKRKIDLKSHLSCIHDIGVTWYHCQEEECQEKFKQKSNLKTHLSSTHDIGKHHYPSCLRNKNSRIEYNKTVICRDCYKKATGKESRYETQMSNYLDKIDWLRPYLIGSDKSLKSIDGCTLY